MSKNNNIPKHWQTKKLGEVCKFVRGPFGGSLKKEIFKNDGFAVYEQQHAIYNQFSEIRYFIDENKFNEMKRFELNSGDLIMSCSGTMGKVSIVPKNIKKGIINQALLKLSPSDQVSNVFLKIWMDSMTFQESLKSFSKGAAIQNVASVSVLKNIEIPLPPLPEQQAILTKIEELFSNLENGKQQLQTAQQQLKVYRQSLLKWAFEGKLTEKWRNQSKETYSLAAEPRIKYSSKNELPEGWKIKELKEITSVLGDGLHGTPSYSETGEYYFINGNNLTDGKIEIKENTKRVSNDEFQKYKKPLNEKTIFVSINGTLGYTAFYNNEKVILGKSACYFNVLDTIDKNYIRYYLTSNSFINYANKNATGSTIKNVGLKTMRELQIPIPASLSEQQLIVSELDSKLTICDKIEETISQSLQQAEALRQSILKRAFEGKLI